MTGRGKSRQPAGETRRAFGAAACDKHARFPLVVRPGRKR